VQAERPDPGSEVPALETQRAEVQRRIERAVQMVLAGTEDVPSLRAVLVALERERLRLESQLAAAREPHGDLGDLDTVVGAILAELEDIRSVLLHGEPEQRRELVRRFLAGIRIEKPTRQAVLSWYDLPRPPTNTIRMVELRGVEPLTPRLPASCSPN
jgi:hypothetical protein